MTPRRARVLLIVSLAVLAAVGVAWSLGAAGEPRADLAGDAVTSSSLEPGARIVPPTSTTTTLLATPSGAVAAVVPPAPAPGVPTRISIPALGVDAPVTPVGLERDGSMEIPKASEAGWYRFGVRPGTDTGSAVIAAHVDHDGQRGVFFDLRLLEVGAEVSVTDEAGAAHRYVVAERFQVGKSQLPVDELFRSGGSPVLTLITCGGGFNQRARRYADNIVVRAVPA